MKVLPVHVVHTWCQAELWQTLSWTYCFIPGLIISNVVMRMWLGTLNWGFCLCAPVYPSGVPGFHELVVLFILSMQSSHGHEWSLSDSRSCQLGAGGPVAQQLYCIAGFSLISDCNIAAMHYSSSSCSPIPMTSLQTQRLPNLGL
jgi:hypothetical protein